MLGASLTSRQPALASRSLKAGMKTGLTGEEEHHDGLMGFRLHVRKLLFILVRMMISVMMFSEISRGPGASHQFWITLFHHGHLKWTKDPSCSLYLSFSMWKRNLTVVVERCSPVAGWEEKRQQERRCFEGRLHTFAVGMCWLLQLTNLGCDCALWGPLSTSILRV